jgi:excisionase family DNA binding protein
VTREQPKSYPPETILTAAEVAEWLGVSKRTFERMAMPCVLLGGRTRRYLAKDVWAWLERRRVA